MGGSDGDDVALVTPGDGAVADGPLGAAAVVLVAEEALQLVEVVPVPDAQPLGVWLRRVMRGDECGLGLSEARDRIMLLLSACSDEVAMLKSSQPMSCMGMEHTGGRRHP